MSFISGNIGLYDERLTVVLGFVTLAAALATFVSCRTFLSFLERLGLKSPINAGWYKAFYKYHGYYWWVFVMGLILHLLTAVMHTAIPKAGDPDAPIHWTILGFALGAAAMTGAVLFSCRSLTGLLNTFTGKAPIGNKRYFSFYRYHSYYWLILILAIAGHFAASYVHIGVWPG